MKKDFWLDAGLHFFYKLEGSGIDFLSLLYWPRKYILLHLFKPY